MANYNKINLLLLWKEEFQIVLVAITNLLSHYRCPKLRSSEGCVQIQCQAN